MLVLGSVAWANGPAAPAEAPGVRVTAVPAKTEVTVGETFLVELRAEGPAGTSWTFPTQAGDEHLDLRAVPQASPVPGAAPSAAPAPNVMRYEAGLFALKDAAIPAVAVQYRLADGSEGEAKSEPVPLRVASLLPKDTKEQELADIRGPLALGIGRAFWIAAVLLAAAFVGLALWLVRRRRPQAAVVPRVELGPDVEALAALEALLQSGQIERDSYRPFYIALTGIAKRYLERRLSAPVLEMTSAEMTSFLRDHPHGQAFATPLRDLAGAADQIKFAKGAGQHEEAERHVLGVRELVAGLEARLRPQAAPLPLAAKRGEGSAA